MEAELIAHELDERIPARALLEDLLVLCRPHAEALGCAAELDAVARLADRTGARRQLELKRSLGSLPRVVAVLADDFLAGLPLSVVVERAELGRAGSRTG